MPTPASPPAEFDFKPVRPVFIGLLIGMFTSSISMTVVGPAIPQIVADLGGVQYYSWLSTITMLVSAVVTPISGKLSDMFGRRRFYLGGLVIFLLGSVLSGASQSFEWLVAARALQGVGMGVLMPLSQTIIGDLIPARQRGKYQGYMGAVMGFSQVAGPLLGGWITDAFTWRWLFYINLPIGLIAFIVLYRNLHLEELDVERRIDVKGITTMTLGVTSFLVGISLGGTSGWSDPVVLTLIIAGLLLLAAFVFVELRAAEPIIPMQMFRNSIFTWSVIASMLIAMAMIAVLVYVPVYAQGVLGVSATASGLVLIPMNIAVFGLGIVIGILITKTGRYKEFAIAGTMLVFLASLLMLRLDGDSTLVELAVYTTLFGLGLGMCFQIYTLVVQNAVQRRNLGVATASLQFFRNLGNTLGAAIAGTIMTTHLLAGIEDGMTPAIQEVVPPEGIDPNAVLNPQALAQYPAPVQDLMHTALADSMHQIFVMVPFLTAGAFIATLFIKVLPLRDTVGSASESGQEILDSTAMSSPEQDRQPSRSSHERSQERMFGMHLLLLVEQSYRDNREMLREAITEVGGDDLVRGRQLIRSAGYTLITEDPDVIDEHEAYAVELTQRGLRKRVLSDSLNDRLTAIADEVADAPRDAPTVPRAESVQGLDRDGLRRALLVLDTTMVADVALHQRRTPEEPLLTTGTIPVVRPEDLEPGPERTEEDPPRA